jgi:hypothetical protein
MRNVGQASKDNINVKKKQYPGAHLSLFVEKMRGLKG